MPDLTQPDWPLAFETLPDGTVQLAETPQDGPQDRRARAAVVVCTPKGHRFDEPSFGITPLPFQTGAIDTGRLAAEINQSDPGIDAQATEVMDMLDHTHRIVTIAVDDA